MEKRQLGRTGLMVSPLAIGGAPFGYQDPSSKWDPYSAEGRTIVFRTIERALELGINYFDTAASYGDGHSEMLFGEMMKLHRSKVVLASKVKADRDRRGAIEGVHESLRRLHTDHIDVMQLHGQMFTQADYEHIVGDDGPLQGLLEMQKQGKIRFVGITSEEPYSLLPFLKHKVIDVYQIHYNIIHQGAGRHFLVEAARENVGVVTMRTMTAGIFQIQAHYLAPEWQASHDIGEVNLRFVIADTRVHVGIVGMRWPEEVERNVAAIAGWTPPVDVANLPRWTFEVYKHLAGG
jgi:aryl-alcohol dehydrogenase-like predicted oxidoreductase